MRKPTKYAVIFIISAALAVGVFLLGGREGYQYAFYKINQAIVHAPKPYWLVLTPDGVVAATFNPSATICTPGRDVPSGIQAKIVRMPSKYDDPCNPKSWTNPSYGVRIAEEKNHGDK